MLLRVRSLRLSGCWRISCAALVLAACDSHADTKVELRDGDCMSCHSDEVDGTKRPPHALVRFEDECANCHDQDSWSPAPGFVHVEAFPLTLGHENRECNDCHGAGYAEERIQRECVECHEQSAEKVQDPVHAGLTTDCFACHRTDAFLPARFVHSWPLAGKHTDSECRSCHEGNPATYEGTSTLCVSCHREERMRADADSVEHATYPDTCQGCHSDETFVVEDP